MMFIIQQQARTLLVKFSDITYKNSESKQYRHFRDANMQLFIYVIKNWKATNHLLRNITVYFDTPQAGIPEGCFAS